MNKGNWPGFWLSEERLKTVIQCNVDIVKCLVSRHFFTIGAFFTIQHVFYLKLKFGKQQIVYYTHIFYYSFLYPCYSHGKND